MWLWSRRGAGRRSEASRGWGVGGEGIGEREEGHLSTGKIITKEYLYTVLAEALQGVVHLKEALDLFL